MRKKFISAVMLVSLLISGQAFTLTFTLNDDVADNKLMSV